MKNSKDLTGTGTDEIRGPVPLRVPTVPAPKVPNLSDLGIRPMSPIPKKKEGSADNALMNLEDLRLPQKFSDAGEFEPVRSPVRVRRPGKHEFFRAHPDESYRLQTKCLLMEDSEKEYYIVNRSLWDFLEGEAGFASFEIALCVGRTSSPFLWPVRLPRGDRTQEPWTYSTLAALDQARQRWVRTYWNHSNRVYDVVSARSDLSVPVWPTASFEDILKDAFRDRFISDEDHVVLKKLRGEI